MGKSGHPNLSLNCREVSVEVQILGVLCFWYFHIYYISTDQEIYRKTDEVKSKQIFTNFHVLAKHFETCIIGANDDLDGKTTHSYWFLHTNNKGTKMSKTSHSAHDQHYFVQRLLKFKVYSHFCCWDRKGYLNHPWNGSLDNLVSLFFSIQWQWKYVLNFSNPFKPL